jgi:site-specific recombinase XerD
MIDRKVRKKRAGLEVEDAAKARAAAKALGPLEHAFLEWLYTNGARASEPGLARMSDVDMRAGTVMLHHLKGGQGKEPMPMSQRCREALAVWLAERPRYLALAPSQAQAQADYVFPSQHPGPCYPCQGEGEITVKRKKAEPARAPCPHCRATGTRWGLTRHEAMRIIRRIFKAAGLPADLAFPHVFRHSAATHMLDRGTNPAAIQERLGHKALATTLGYMHTTKEARAAVNRTFDED